jgi:hypothetical protein
MTTIELKQELCKFLTPVYPNIKIEIVDGEDGVRSLYFTEEKFKLLYPKQRYHYLTHLIPADFLYRI